MNKKIKKVHSQEKEIIKVICNLHSNQILIQGFKTGNITLMASFDKKVIPLDAILSTDLYQSLINTIKIKLEDESSRGKEKLCEL